VAAGPGEVRGQGGIVTLSEFVESCGPEIVSWINSEAEARVWCGLDLESARAPALFASWHADPDVHPYVLRDEATLVAYGEVWVDSAEAETELARIIVNPQHRGQGVGRNFVRLLARSAEAFGYARTFLRVVPGNLAAIGCYSQAGFIPVSEADARIFNHGQPVEYVWMVRERGSAH
jgi:ribosomal protein S18 acetylase RimI-like enzyme